MPACNKLTERLVVTTCVCALTSAALQLPPPVIVISALAAAALGWLSSYFGQMAYPSPPDVPRLPPLYQRSRSPQILSPEQRDLSVRRSCHVYESLRTQKERAACQQASQNDNSAFAYLPCPAIEAQVQNHSLQVSTCQVGVCSAQGRRDSMEDEHLSIAFQFIRSHDTPPVPVVLFGIFDGHGGALASQYLKQNLQSVLTQILGLFCKDSLSDENIWNALKITFVRLHRDFLTEYPKDRSGSTATVAIILNGKLWVANVGDSRTILTQPENGSQLSEDAKPQDPYYKNGIEHRGGFVLTAGTSRNLLNRRLATARAIGDRAVERGLNPRPKITMRDLADIPPKTHLILACDGLYDVASTRQVANVIRAQQGKDPEALARDLVFSALQARSEDNVSVLVIPLSD